jgi:hypothetical protein
MSRDQHRRHVPFCESRVAIVDQYMWKEKDTTERLCHNGQSHGIYNCRGEISRTLPLDMYPRVNEVHPQVERIPVGPHFEARDPNTRRMIAMAQRDKAEGRVEGLYVDGESTYNPRAEIQRLQNMRIKSREGCCGDRV